MKQTKIKKNTFFYEDENGVMKKKVTKMSEKTVKFVASNWIQDEHRFEVCMLEELMSFNNQFKQMFQGDELQDVTSNSSSEVRKK